MNIKDVTYAIGIFIEKYYNDTNRVELPKWGFIIKQIFNVKVLELKEVSDNLWTFKAATKITKTEEFKSISMEQTFNIIGSAKVTSHIGRGTTEQLPVVELVKITQISEPK